MKTHEASTIVGGLGKPSKMPGKAYGLPAKECNVGSKLRDVPGSVCETCYALKGRYVFDNVQTAQYRRLEALNDPRWVSAMVTLVKDRVSWFRWHDSGDLRDATHFGMICAVAIACPDTQFWLPTKETGVIRRWLAAGQSIPSNLIVRVSGAMVDGAAPKGHAHTSTVHKSTEITGHECPARHQAGKCGDCRACWDYDVPNIAYPWH